MTLISGITYHVMIAIMLTSTSTSFPCYSDDIMIELVIAFLTLKANMMSVM